MSSQRRIFENKIGNVRIEYILDKISKNVILDFINYEPEYVKIFLFTLRNSIEVLIDENYNGFIQFVEYNDWNLYLKNDNLLTCLSQENNICKIYCDINNAIGCVSRGLGIYENTTKYETFLDLE